MGGIFSYPESMKDLPGNLNSDQYIKMVLTDNGNKDGIYFIQKRNYLDQVGNSIKQSFSAQSIGLDMLGLGGFKNLNKSKVSEFYVTKDKLDGEPIVSTVSSNLLKMYIKAFTFEQGIKLDSIQNAIFTVETKNKISSFGKRNFKKNLKKKLKRNLKKN